MEHCNGALVQCNAFEKNDSKKITLPFIVLRLLPLMITTINDWT